MSDKRVELILNILGKKEALDTLQQVIQYKREISNTKADLRLDIYNAKNQLLDIQNQIAKTQRAMSDLGKEGKNANNAHVYAHLANRMAELQTRAQEVNNELQGYRNSMGAAVGATQALNDAQRDLIGTQKEVAKGFESIANAFQKMGDFSGMIGNFASGIGGAFSNMAGLFQSNFIDVVGIKLTAMMTEAFTGHAQDVVARADILNTFEDYMEIAGVSADQANAALDRVDKSIRGLPIGLDESAQRLRRYQMFLGDIDRATNITIGLQRAITAGGASEQMRRMAYYQIDRLLSVGELSTARQWNSLITGLGVSVKFLAEAMGEGGMTAAELAGGMLNGRFSAEQLLDALAKLGEGTDETAQGLQEALNVYLGTYQSWLSNIGFAMTRGAERLLAGVNDALLSSTGTSIVGYMKRFRDGLDEMYLGMAAWSRENPDLFGTLVGSIERLVNAFQSLQFDTFGRSVFGYLTQAVDLLANALGKLNGPELAKFVAFATTIASPLGKIFTAMSSGLPILLGVFRRFEDFDWEGLIQNMIVMADLLARVVENMLNLLPDNVMSGLLAFGLTWGKPLEAALHGVAGAISIMGSASMAAAGGVGAFSAALSALSFAIPIVGGITAAIVGLTTAWSYFEQNPPTTGGQWTAFAALFGLPGLNRKVTDVGKSMAIPLSTESTSEEINAARANLAQLKKDLEAVQQAQANDHSILRRNSPGYEVNNMYAEAIREQEKYLELVKDSGDAHVKLTADEKKWQESIKASSEYDEEAAEKINLYEGSLSALQTKYDELKQDLTSTFTSTFGGFEGYEAPDPLGIGDMSTNIETSNQAMRDFESNVKEVMAYLDENNIAGQESILAQLYSGEFGPAEVAFQSLADGIKSGSEETLPVLEKLAEQIQLINQLSEDINWFSTDEEKFSAGMDMLNQYIEGYEKLSDPMKRAMEAAGFEYVLNDFIQNTMPSAETTAQLLAQAIANGMLSNDGAMRLVGDHYSGILAEQINATLPGLIVRAGGGEGVEGTAHFLEEAFGAQDFGATIGGLEELSDAADDASGNMSNAADAGKDAADGINEMGNAASNNSGKVQGMADAASNLAGAASSARSEVSMLRAEMNLIQSKEVTLTVNTVQNGSFMPSTTTSKWAESYSTGGPVYAADGKLISFIPKGTDTIPAMLTNGEFVHNSRAVNFFGKDFMERVNSLDLTGALKSLLSMKSIPAFAGGGSVTYNNQRDNHAVVNQTIVTNNQNYSQRVAIKALGRL